MKLLIIIPAYNEAENIERVVDNLIQNYPQYDYVSMTVPQMTPERSAQGGDTICWIFR